MMKQKRGQQKLSFGMIFSIILIVLFISFAVWGVTKLIQTKENVEIEKFPSDLQDDVDEVWKSTYGEQKTSYTLPKEIDKVCFMKTDFGKNMKLTEKKDGLDRTRGEYNIEHIDIDSIVSEGEGGEYCIENVDKNIKLTLKKEEGNSQVIIEKRQD